MVDEALARATDEKLRETLDGTIGDSLAFCWGALTQYERRGYPWSPTTPREHGQRYAEMHTLLILAHEAVCHADQVTRLLDRMGRPSALPPDQTTRARLAQARNLLAEHRDERLLYWRLTGYHTPHVIGVYGELGVDLPAGAIDSEQFADVGSATEFHWGTVGGLLSLGNLQIELSRLEEHLVELATEFRA